MMTNFHTKTCAIRYKFKTRTLIAETCYLSKYLCASLQIVYPQGNEIIVC